MACSSSAVPRLLTQAQFQAALADLSTAATGYSQLLTEATVPRDDPATLHELFSGLQLTLPHLERAGTLAALAVSPEVQQRRAAALKEWQCWALQFPTAIRPSLMTCTPAEVVCFLEQWRVSRRGRARPGDAPGSNPDIAPSTLRNYASQLSQLCLIAGRADAPWALSSPGGNPVTHASVTDYIAGYANHCFLNTSYVDSGAVPITLATYVRLMDYLVDKAAEETNPYQSALLWRDACLTAYLWETGQRGKEGCQLLVTDFCYGETRCTPAWLDLVEGKPNTNYPLLVESSRGTKSRKTKHPGTLELETEVNPALGTGFMVRLIPPYACAMRASGRPLLSRLFMKSNATQDGFDNDDFKSDAFNKRLQKHLKAIGLWGGETTHSLRRGSTQLLKELGATVSEIGEKRLWRRDTTIDLYLHKTRHRARLVGAAQHGPEGPSA